MNYYQTFKATTFSSALLFIHFTLAIPIISSAQNKSAQNSISLKNYIHEERFIVINGIEQWVTINGERSKPIILFIHGGPGSPISPYSANLYKDWLKDFIIVQWDQRGTGRTFGRTAPEELTPGYLKSNPLSLQQMVDDGIELSGYLLKYLGKNKLILFGTSWGSALGVKIVTKHPAIFYAYIGHSQIINPSDYKPLYNKVFQMATNKKDTTSLAILNTIGYPPYSMAKEVGRLLRIVKKYESENSIPAPDDWFKVSAAYDNPKDNQNRSDGDDYSFVNYTGDSRFEVQSMSATINLLKDNLDFKIPVYLIQGSEDLLTPKETTKEYFNKIKAPKKKYYILPKTAHGFNKSVLETQYKIMKALKI